MVIGPLVDDVHRLSVVEVARLRTGIIIVVGHLGEICLQLIGLVHEDGIGDHSLRLCVEVWTPEEHFAVEIVDGLRTRIAEA